MKEITFKLDNIYKVFNEFIKNKNLILSEVMIKDMFAEDVQEDWVTNIERHVDKDLLKKVLVNEIIRKSIIDQSTLSTSTIEGEIVDESTYEKAETDLNSINKDERQKYSSILSLADLLDRYNLPGNITSDDLKYIHRKIFSGKKYNPGNFKASDNFVVLNKEEKLKYVSASQVDIELNKLWEFFNDKDTDGNPIIKASLIHMYLALIHPFADGNGRVIRLVVNKYLSRTLGKDVYLDKYILENMDLYKENLNLFRSDDQRDKAQFPIFVMNLLSNYRLEHVQTTNKHLKLFEIIANKFIESGRIPHSKGEDITLFVVKNNLFTISQMENDLGMTRITANKYAKILVDLKLYEEQKSGKKNIYIKTNKYRI